jgi:fucose permease
MKKYIVTTIYIFIFMTFIGFSENMRGLFIPIFKEEFRINNSMIGVMLTVSSLAYIIFQYIGGILIQRHGHKRIYLSSLILIILSFLMIWKSGSFYILLLAMFIFNVGVSLFSISTNSLIPVLFIGYQAILMNLTHFCYGLGTSAGQRTVGILLKRGLNWREAYLGSALVFFILLLIFFFIKFPQVDVDKADKGVKFLDAIKDKRILLFVAALGLYVFSELSVANWFANFMITGYSLDGLTASYYLSLFFFIFTIGRFLGGFVVEKIGHFKALFSYLSIAILLFTMGLVLGKKYLILISASGFFFSIGFPTIVLLVSNTFQKNRTYILGLVIALTSTVNMILNFLVGFLNDTIGVYYTFFLIPIALLVSLTILIYIKLKVWENS